ncbi:hypothetical protein PRIPAC_85874 [Pristionchus pacificus]|uniref:Uncharacterized protein n=1 Tax=Pristionchus pacificus TaxID=54126 RepID=A0A2A6BGT6_PRIPA|nr:hypothetical protein PRIPAC_85874 [Pristionchus pacificus]|eukprot:PDM65090.1 hypothetical protein PRIPAC_53339 [Pristionchus pacificus]
MKCFLIFILVLSIGESLNKFLKHYEPLNYQPTDLNRVSRSTDEKIRLNFHAYDRDFKLILERVHEKDSVFLKDAIMEYENKTEKIEWEDNIFKGMIEGDDNSYVSGSINHGIFEGVIETSNGEEFWIESSYPYNSTLSLRIHIIQRHLFILSYIQQMIGNRFYDRRLHDNDRDGDQLYSPYKTEHSRQPEPHKRNTENKRRPYLICEDELKGKGLHSQSLLKKPQHKRETVSMDENGIWRNRICTLKIMIDHTLYEYVFNGAGRGDASATRSELKTMMENQLKLVNKIYEKIDFGGITGIHFKIAGFRFYTKANDIANPFVKETTISQTFLDWHSASDFSEYCLSYVFTYRDFDQDTLGLAFSCDACTKAGAHNGRVSHNTGMVTFRSNERQRHLTLAHELGHSLGSDHDHQPLASGKLESEVYPECDSDGKTGHYIMYPNANDGKKANHHLLSVCSIRNITRNLKRLLAIDPKLKHPQQTNCFISESTPICGNLIIEEGEVCDCGHNEQECLDQRDQCCWHGDHNLKCQLKSTAYECSPTQGSCCSENCKFKGASVICAGEKDCTATTYCLPGNYTCPASKPINNGLPCDDATGNALQQQTCPNFPIGITLKKDDGDIPDY